MSITTEDDPKSGQELQSSAVPPVYRGKRWTKEEDHIVKVYYPRRGSIYVAGLLGRTMTSVQARALKMGVKSKLRVRWKIIEERHILKRYAEKEAKSIARTLKRTEQSVRGKIHLLGGLTDPSRPWTEQEVEFLRSNYASMTSRSLGTQLGRTTEAIQLKASKTGLLKRKRIRKLSKKDMKYIKESLGREKYTVIARKLGVDPHRIARVCMKAFGYQDRPTSRAWTAEDDEQLRGLYGTMPPEEIAGIIQRTVIAVNERSRRLRPARLRRQ